MTALTIPLSDDLKKKLDAFCAAHDQDVATFVQEAVIERLRLADQQALQNRQSAERIMQAIDGAFARQSLTIKRLEALLDQEDQFGFFPTWAVEDLSQAITDKALTAERLEALLDEAYEDMLAMPAIQEALDEPGSPVSLTTLKQQLA